MIFESEIYTQQIISLILLFHHLGFEGFFTWKRYKYHLYSFRIDRCVQWTNQNSFHEFINEYSIVFDADSDLEWDIRQILESTENQMDWDVEVS